MGSRYSSDSVAAHKLVGRYSLSISTSHQPFERILQISSPSLLYLDQRRQPILIHTSAHSLMKQSGLHLQEYQQSMSSTTVHSLSEPTQSHVMVTWSQSNTVCASRVTTAYDPVAHVRSKRFEIPQNHTPLTMFLFGSLISKIKILTSGSPTNCPSDQINELISNLT